MGHAAKGRYKLRVVDPDLRHCRVVGEGSSHHQRTSLGVEGYKIGGVGWRLKGGGRDGFRISLFIFFSFPFFFFPSISKKKKIIK